MALPDILVGDGLEDEGLVTGVPGHRGHLVQQQPVMVPGHLVSGHHHHHHDMSHVTRPHLAGRVAVYGAGYEG